MATSEQCAGKYRVGTTRLQKRDYAEPGTYFVTICTRGKICWFGDIENGNMALSPIGNIVVDEITRTSKIRPTVTIDYWVVMPDHVHLIVEIIDQKLIDVMRYTCTHQCRDVCCCRDALTGRLYKRNPGRLYKRNNRKWEWRPDTLGAIINHIKRKCTMRIHAMGYNDFSWQPRFHDRIIRSAQEFHSIRQYIHSNPKDWHSFEKHFWKLLK